jgi:hypothetical protein
MEIVGREREKAELKRYMGSGRPEFVAVYGRRRVGKTFLIREYFENEFFFYFTGVAGGKRQELLKNFDIAINRYGGDSSMPSKNWSEAFLKLRGLIENASGNERRVVFLGELPWLDTKNSDFLTALDYFWNSFASARPDLLFIVCGSAASWVIKKLFKNRGGLHNRITGRIHMSPFTLRECEEYFSRLGVVMNRYQIVESYSVFGGIPFYLSMFDSGLGLAQNIDRLFFEEDAPLGDEYTELYHSLFSEPERPMAIVHALAGKRYGMTRDELTKATGIPDGGHFSANLEALEQSDFIVKYADFTRPSHGAYYRLSDPFSLFWRDFGKEGKESKDEYFWTNRREDGERRAWSGYAFEETCLSHIPQIKNKLGISGVATRVTAWRSREAKPGAQIDLIIDRADGVINLCEMKFTQHPYTITKDDDAALLRKRQAFASETRTKKALHMTMVTTYGLTQSGYRGAVQSEVTMDDLFAI